MAGDTGSNAESILEQLVNQTENIGTSSLQNIVEMLSNAGASADDIGGVLSSIITLPENGPITGDALSVNPLSSLIETFMDSFGNAASNGSDGLNAILSMLTPDANIAETTEPTLSIYQNRMEREPVDLNGLYDLFLLPGRIVSSLAGAALGTLNSLPEATVNGATYGFLSGSGVDALTGALLNAGKDGILGQVIGMGDGILGQVIGMGIGTMADAFTGAVTGTLLGTPVGAGLGALTGAMIGTGFDILTGSLIGSILSSPIGAATGSLIGGIVGTALLPAKWIGAAALGTATTLLGPAKWIDALAGAGMGALLGAPMAGILEFVVRPLLIIPEAIAALGVSELINVPLGLMFGKPLPLWVFRN